MSIPNEPIAVAPHVVPTNAPQDAAAGGDVAAQRAALERKSEELARANRRLLLLNQLADDLILGGGLADRGRAAFAAVAEEIGAEYFFHYIVDEARSETLDLVFGHFGDLPAAAFQTIGFGEGLSGGVAQSLQPLIADDLAQAGDAAAAARAVGIRAFAALPLVAHGQLLGVIGFGSARPAAFAPADIALMKSLADQFAATLDRSRLLQTVRASEARYRAAFSAGRMGTWETDLVNRTRLWTREGMDLFGIDLPGGRGHVGGDDDEYVRALHPEDRHLRERFHEMADRQDTFTSEYRVVWPDGTVLWLRGTGQVTARGPDGKAQRMISIVADVTERKAAEDHIQFLMYELSHRSKNLLTVVQAIARRTAANSATMEEFEIRFGRRLQGLAASHDVLVRNNWEGAPLADLVRQQLIPFAETHTARFQLGGPDVVLTAEAGQSIGLAVHELATNAVKYGALSTPEGKVAMSWQWTRDAGGQRVLRLDWIEQGGPPVEPPQRKGFGHVVIDDMITRALNGDVVVDFAPGGLSWRALLPARNVVSARRGAQESVPSPH